VALVDDREPRVLDDGSVHEFDLEGGAAVRKLPPFCRQ